jgi:branched-chain amino acid transport system permease protein
MPPFGSNAGRLLIMVAAVACIAQWHTSLYATSITIGIYSLLAVPLGLIYGLGGILSLAQGAFAALGAYSSAILFTRLGLSPAATLLPAILIPAAFA